MALFIDYKVQAPDKTDTLCCAWCHTEPVLAVSTNANQVNFYGDEGDRLQGCEFKRNVNPVCIDWRPKSQVCAVGWADGCVSLWSTKSRVAKEDAQLHRDAKIVFVKWSPEGSRFVAGDDKGLVSVWKTDHRGRLTRVSSCELV